MKGTESALSRIDGGQALIDWFGAVPSFHDGEVLGLRLERDGVSSLVVRGHRMTSETDARGYFILDRKFVATFGLEGIDMLRLEDFTAHNIIYGLSIEARPDAAGYVVELEPCYGLWGTIGCTTLRVSFQPDEGAS